jgi:KipI family sensor histidine kinase inhibitor
VLKASAAGDSGLLIDTDGPAVALAAAITGADLPGVTDVIAGARSVLVICSPGRGLPLGELARLIAALPVPEHVADPGDSLELPVVYDGPDLAEVAELSGLTVDEVIAAHSGARYTVGWMGFAPGFGYLTGLDRRLSDVPRLATPRLTVPAGSVAIAAGLAAVYPSASPGGWRILGRTDAALWDADREPAALLAPGRQVRFTVAGAGELGEDRRRGGDQGRPERSTGRAADPPGAGAGDAGAGTAGAATAGAGEAGAGEAGAATAGAGDAGAGTARAGGQVEVVRPGPLATVQDLGRPGFGAMGVPPSGAADPVSLIAANRLVGNPDDAAGIELTLGRAAFRFAGQARVAVTGAPAAVRVSDDAGSPARPADFGRCLEVPAGGMVSVGSPSAGLRSYLAVAGGIAGPAVLGSRSADLLSGLGGGPLRAGDMLSVGEPRHTNQPETDQPGTRRPGTGPAGTDQPGTGPAGTDQPATGPAGTDQPGTGPAGTGPVGTGPGPADTSRLGTAIPTRGAVTRLRVSGGPRLDWFAAEALDRLCSGVYTVTPASNRTGLRLTGPALAAAHEGQLPSEGVVTGALQVPADGNPILLLADHPTTGGYPVIAVVLSADVPVAGQLRPGDQLAFTLAV